jgi:BlaI family penicillinase repressor
MNGVSMKKQDIRLGKVQQLIMQFLWEHGESTARAISDFVTATEPISHSTVQTLLRKLEQKNAVVHVERDRVFFFSAIADREDVTSSTTREFMNRVFQGSATSLVSHLLAHEKISSDEIQQLHQMIEEYREKLK